MTKWDRNNLEFLLTLDVKGIAQWAQQASDDDMAYAQQLLAMHQTELELAQLDLLDSAVTDTDQATAYLSKFKL